MRRKNSEKVTAPTISIVALAAVSVRSRKIRSGRSGARERSSITTNASTSANEPARRPIVVLEPHPSVVARVMRVDEQHQAGGDRDGARDVEVPRRLIRAALPQEHRREGDRGECDRDVDEEDPGPAQVRRQHAAEEDADCRAASGCTAVDAERDVAVAALAERRHQERERGRGEQRATEALQGAEGDERGLRPGESAEERARREHGEARDEEAAPAEQVAEPAAEEQRATEEDRIRGDDPLQARLRKAEVGLDRRQRDVHDGDVEDDHELCGHDEGQGAPAPLRPSSHIQGTHLSSP